MLAPEQLQHLGTCPEYRTIAVSCHHMNRAVGIECRVEGHAGTYTYILNLPLGIDRSLNGMPSQLHYRTIHLSIYPTLVASR